MISRIWTIGHSTREIDSFVSLLKENGIKLLVDVRSWPGSKRYPQFNKEALAESLADAGIRYEHLPELGGRRKPKPESHNTAGRTGPFPGSAAKWRPKEFQKGWERCLALPTKAGLPGTKDRRSPRLTSSHRTI